MLKKNWGRVIFISSESGQHIPAEMIHCGMTKTAQVAVALAESVAGTGVTVNSVLAGPTASEGAGNFVESLAKHCRQHAGCGDQWGCGPRGRRSHSQHFLASTTATNTCYYPLFVLIALKPVHNVRRRFRLARTA
jgi:NAD(P)-dependent dehydrogenase (short-subunit alcohol dehydrogenase family)